MDLDGVYRAEFGRCVATLVRFLGDINLTEEAVQDAFAVEKWETLPPNPGDGPAAALAALRDVDLPGYHLLPATRADLLVRLGRESAAAAAYDQAIAMAGNDTERAFLQTRRGRLDSPPGAEGRQT